MCVARKWKLKASANIRMHRETLQRINAEHEKYHFRYGFSCVICI